MSMLTPLGAGGHYRRPRRWPKVLAVVLVLALLGAGAYGVWWWLQQDDGSDTAESSPPRVCRTPTVAFPDPVLPPRKITVNVANGTSRAGLALDTADALAERGFQIDDIGNTDKPVKQGVAVVWYRPEELDAAVTVAAFVPGSRLSTSEGTRVPTLWLGPDFAGAPQGIAQSKDADPESVELPTKEPICRMPGATTKKQKP